MAGVLPAGQQRDEVVMEVTAQQFFWNVRYSGADGRFGRTRTQLIDEVANPVRLDPSDAAVGCACGFIPRT